MLCQTGTLIAYLVTLNFFECSHLKLTIRFLNLNLEYKLMKIKYFADIDVLKEMFPSQSHLIILIILEIGSF